MKTTVRPKFREKNIRSRFVPAEEPFPSEAQAAFQRLVKDFAFPCIGATAALNSGAISYGFYDRLGAEVSTKNLARDLERFTPITPQNRLATMIAVFRGPFELREVEFEKLLRSQLQKLHAEDALQLCWDARVGADPNAPNFSFSFAGQAYYVIGMHANSSREARRFPWPTLIFNPHEQFERLREDGNCEHTKQTIRSRDLALQGRIPMLSDFRETSEARQYSGRAVEENWTPPPFVAPKCPFAH